MKNSRKFIIISLLLFLLFTIGITSWYILSLNYLEKYDLKTIIKIAVEIGAVGAILPSLTISLMYYFILKIKNKSLLLLLIIFLIIFLIFQLYWITVNLFLFDIKSSESFLQALLEVF
ncbi:hypothetical protein [Chryseobacterium gwangjuense]|uniref:hypothetical protein n=1 Tax=Chryseobacterium gwangjuense TaxID=1069980 RepID=UPI001E442552|nr:hypothetical protein [Chryseobacterium gwangjuense]MCE3075691.1 hypothetical protein [Chryseobacterium gwangjuense]